eukprot:1775664-Pyramimonas_sp.AAC.1
MAFSFLSTHCEWDSDNPLHVHCDCAATITCATDPGAGLSVMQAGQLYWRDWWAEVGVGHRAKVTKEKSHQAETNASSDHEVWLIRGNAAADAYAKRGARLWGLPPEQVQFFQGLECMAAAAVRWHARAQQVFDDSGFLDSHGVAGTSDVTLESDPSLWDELQEASLEQGVRPFEDVSGVRLLDAAAAPPPGPPLRLRSLWSRARGPHGFFNGHSVVQAALIQIEGGVEVQPGDAALF